MSYINREEAIRQIEEVQSLYIGQLFDLIGRTLDIVKNMPEENVDELIHAHWTEVKCGDGIYDYYFVCSNCGKATRLDKCPIAPDYCPHCPAKMDEEVK